MIYLNRFRRKPAITKFDQPFTPNLQSSPSFATDVSSVLKFLGYSTCLKLDHLASGVINHNQFLQFFKFRLIKLLVHYTKGTLQLDPPDLITSLDLQSTFRSTFNLSFQKSVSPYAQLIVNIPYFRLFQAPPVFFFNFLHSTITLTNNIWYLDFESGLPVFVWHGLCLTTL